MNEVESYTVLGVEMSDEVRKTSIVRSTFVKFLTENGILWLTMTVLVIGLSLGIYTIWIWRDLFGVGVLGLETFFIILIAGMVNSSKTPMDQGQVRRAVVAAWVAAFFGLLAVGNGIVATGSVIANTLSQFWWAFTLVFSTYIAGRTVESVTQSWATTRQGAGAGAPPKP